MTMALEVPLLAEEEMTRREQFGLILLTHLLLLTSLSGQQSRKAQKVLSSTCYGTSGEVGP